MEATKLKPNEYKCDKCGGVPLAGNFFTLNKVCDCNLSKKEVRRCVKCGMVFKPYMWKDELWVICGCQSAKVKESEGW